MKKRIRLKIEEPNSKYEHEADRVANDIMKKKSNISQYDTEAQKVVPFTHEEALQFLEKRIAETKEASKRLENVVDDSEMIPIKSKGKHLSNTSLDYFEPRFGYDFSNVKIHDDEKAHKMAEELNAKAFTIGNDIVFNKGEFQPETYEGMKLLAHELSHVVQQSKNIHLKTKQAIFYFTIYYEFGDQKGTSVYWGKTLSIVFNARANHINKYYNSGEYKYSESRHGESFNNYKGSNVRSIFTRSNLGKLEIIKISEILNVKSQNELLNKGTSFYRLENENKK